MAPSANDIGIKEYKKVVYKEFLVAFWLLHNHILEDRLNDTFQNQKNLPIVFCQVYLMF